MADRTIRVTVLGDASSMEREFTRGAKSANTFGKEVDKAGKGAIAASLSDGHRGLRKALTGIDITESYWRAVDVARRRRSFHLASTSLTPPDHSPVA